MPLTEVKVDESPQLGAYATAPGDFSDIVRTQKRTLRRQLAPSSQVLDIANLVARQK